MYRILLEVMVLAVLTAIGGTIGNFARSNDAEKFVQWVDDRCLPLEAQAASEPASNASSKASKPIAAVNENGRSTDEPGTTGAAGGTDPAAPTSRAEPETAGGFLVIQFKEAVEEFRLGTPFVDARRTNSYRAGHVTGAYAISAWESDLAAKAEQVRDAVLEKGRPLAAPIVVYCTASKDCEDSQIVARTLQGIGFENIVIYKGGYPEWEAKLKESNPTWITQGEAPGEVEL